MNNIKYSMITKDNPKFSDFLKKLKRDIKEIDDLSKTGDYVFAYDINTNKIIEFINVEEKEDIVINDTVSNSNKEVLSNLFKVIINYAKGKDKDIDLYCEYWKTYDVIKSLGFDARYPDDYIYSLDKRDRTKNKIAELADKAATSEEAANKLEFQVKLLEYFYCRFVRFKEKINDDYQVEGYIDFNELPKELLEVEQEKINDPTIFKEDDKYLYCELKKTDEDYDRIIEYIAKEITRPNLRENGGTLNSYIGLTYPELLIYMKDKGTNEIIGYMGLTERYAEGLYISQIAVRKEYRQEGIGTTLVKEAIKRAKEKNIATVTADINIDNDVSQIMFGKIGFVGKDRYYLDVENYINSNKMY